MLLIRPAGLFGEDRADARRAAPAAAGRLGAEAPTYALIGLLIALGLAAPFVVYPILSRGAGFALFACAFNLLLGIVGLLSLSTPRSSAGPPTSPGAASSYWACRPSDPRRHRAPSSDSPSAARDLPHRHLLPMITWRSPR